MRDAGITGEELVDAVFGNAYHRFVLEAEDARIAGVKFDPVEQIRDLWLAYKSGLDDAVAYNFNPVGGWQDITACSGNIRNAIEDVADMAMDPSRRAQIVAMVQEPVFNADLHEALRPIIEADQAVDRLAAGNPEALVIVGNAHLWDTKDFDALRALDAAELRGDALVDAFLAYVHVRENDLDSQAPLFNTDLALIYRDLQNDNRFGWALGEALENFYEDIGANPGYLDKVRAALQEPALREQIANLRAGSDKDVQSCEDNLHGLREGMSVVDPKYDKGPVKE